MSETNPSILSHVSIGTNDFEATSTLYAKVLATLCCREIMRHPGAVAFGRDYPEFWMQTPINGQPATLGNGSHFGFVAPDNGGKDVFVHVTAVERSGTGPLAENQRVRMKVQQGQKGLEAVSIEAL